MPDRPIIFSAAMIRALLAGRKTQTRRVLKPQPERVVLDTGEVLPVGLMHVEDQPWPRITIGRVIKRQEVRYKPGMKLWVREAHATGPEGHAWGSPIYRASFGAMMDPVCEGFTKWRPSVHMHRWASRLTLTVTEVRLQRLREISEADAVAEGLVKEEGGYSLDGSCSFFHPSARGSFGHLWNAIHDAPYAWADNPWVVAVSFTVEQRNIDA